MADDDPDRTASLMTPAKLAQVKPKAAASPAAWLNQMAADAAHQHVKRIGELRRELKAQGKQRDFSPITAELARFGKALPKLDFDLVQNHGLWSRMTGKSRTATAEFAEQFGKLQGAAESVAAEVQALAKKQQEQAGPTDLSLLEVEVEYKAIEKVQDQGARWLQDMRNQLKARHAEEHDAAAEKQIQDDEARCEILVARLKVLREVSSAAQQVHQQAQATAARRNALVQSLQQGMSGKLKDWTKQLQALAGSAQEGGQPTNLEPAMESHRELQLFVKDAAADCAQLRAQENSLSEGLHSLKAQIEGAKVDTAS